MGCCGGRGGAGEGAGALPAGRGGDDARPDADAAGPAGRSRFGAPLYMTPSGGVEGGGCVRRWRAMLLFNLFFHV